MNPVLFSLAVLCFSSFSEAASTRSLPSPLPSSTLSNPAPVPSLVPSPGPSESAPVLEIPSVRISPLPIELPDLTQDKSGSTVLTLDESIRTAIRSATSVLTTSNELNYSGAQLLQSYGQFLPNLTAQGGYSYSTGTSYFAFGTPALVNGSGIGATASVSSTLNLFNGLADLSALKSALLKRDASELTLVRAKQQIAIDIAQGFLQVILDSKMVEIARKNLEESQAREKLLEAQTKLGARSLSDLFRQEARTSSDESFLFNAQNKMKSDQISFLYKLRMNIEKNYRFIEPELSDSVQKSTFSIEEEMNLVQRALKNRADLKASDLQTNAAQADIRTSWAGYLPKLDFTINAASGGRTLFSQNIAGQSVVPSNQLNLGDQLSRQINYTAGLNLTWNLFDRFLTHQSVSKARMNADNAELRSEDQKNLVRGDARKAFQNYQLSIQQLNSSKKGLTAAEKAYAVMEGRYRVGASSFIDLVTVQTNLVQAEAARAQALIDFQLQKKNIEFATGELAVD